MRTLETHAHSPSLPGIAPKLLLDQVRNTAPFIFEPEFALNFPQSFSRRLLDFPTTDLDVVRYFELCLLAHHTTVATFVPTDVDVHIRFKLWHPSLQTETMEAMAKVVLESQSWDPRPVSARVIESPRTGERLSGHSGEWFSTAAAAYGALQRRSPELAAEIAGVILREIDRECQIYLDFKKARDGIGLLKASTIIAHNLGDLDRVIDQWNLSDDDALKKAVYKAGHTSVPRFGNALIQGGLLNKNFMALENHRHLVLRAPRALRKNAEYLIPIGPFFDNWGATLARHPGLTPREVGEIVEALVIGWEKLPKSVGYARALSGILENFSGGLRELALHIPAKTLRTLKAGTLRTLCVVPKKRFEEQWNQIALRSILE
jgi:hypothetical protein